MSELIEVIVPDIGDFDQVEVIDVIVKVGDSVEIEDPLVTLESDKATMDIPSPDAGVVTEVLMSTGNQVSQGTLILKLESKANNQASSGDDTAKPAAVEPEVESTAQEIVSEPVPQPPQQIDDYDADVIVLGSGPGGYTAAFRAADLGLKTILIERYESLGGVCLNVGCIPSKALLHAAQVIAEARDMQKHGISFGEPEIDLNKLRGWKQEVVGKLTGGLSQLAKRRKVKVITGTGTIIGSNEINIESDNQTQTLNFNNLIIAAGSEVAMIPEIPDDPRIIDSTGALELTDIPGRMLVIGGGIIGLEMATVYNELGTKVTVAELTPTLIPGADKDIVRPLSRRISELYEHIYLDTRIEKIEASDAGIVVTFNGKKAPETDIFDCVLVATGRKPNGHNIGAENARITVDERGFIPVDDQQRTNVSNIFAIGDIVGQPMLAHKATHEAKVAAEVCAGMKSGFDAQVIPSVAYTDPEVAWVGVTEDEAKQQKLDYGKGVFPWAASGRALGLGREEGTTKLLFDNTSKKVIGAGIVGPNAGDLIAEVALAIEMGADAEDISLTIHPHPTLSETIAFSAEAFEGTITDLYIPKRK